MSSFEMRYPVAFVCCCPISRGTKTALVLPRFGFCEILRGPGIGALVVDREVFFGGEFSAEGGQISGTID